MTCANQHLKFGAADTLDGFEIDWPLLNKQMSIDKTCRFTAAQYLFILWKDER